MRIITTVLSRSFCRCINVIQLERKCPDAFPPLPLSLLDNHPILSLCYNDTRKCLGKCLGVCK